MFENPRKGRQARNFTTNAPKILDLKSSSEQIFSRKLPLGAPVSIFHLNRKTLKRARNMDSSQRTFWGVSTVTTRRGWTQNEMHLDTSKRAPKIPISHRLTISHVEPSSSSGFFSHLNFEKTLRMRLNWGTRFFSHSFPRNHRQTTFCSCTLSCRLFEVWSLKFINS